jgi:hypothetical protein
LVPRVVAAAAPTELMVAMVETTIATFSSVVLSKVCKVSFSNTIYYPVRTYLKGKRKQMSDKGVGVLGFCGHHACAGSTDVAQNGSFSGKQIFLAQTVFCSIF